LSRAPDAAPARPSKRPSRAIRSAAPITAPQATRARPLPTLIEEELALGDDANWGNCRYYVGASRYSRQLDNFHRWFPAEQVCVLSFEDLVADADTQLRRLFGFLGIAAPDAPLVLPLANKSRATRFPLLHSTLRATGLKPALSRLLKHNLGGRIEEAAQSLYNRERARVVSDRSSTGAGNAQGRWPRYPRGPGRLIAEPPGEA
jgi:hypothetical protein